MNNTSGSAMSLEGSRRSSLTEAKRESLLLVKSAVRTKKTKATQRRMKRRMKRESARCRLNLSGQGDLRNGLSGWSDEGGGGGGGGGKNEDGEVDVVIPLLLSMGPITARGAEEWIILCCNCVVFKRPINLFG